jgi:hypothetical protein
VPVIREKKGKKRGGCVLLLASLKKLSPSKTHKT